MPLLYLGTLFGVRIGMMMSDIQVAVCLTIVLFYVTLKTALKARELYKQE
jgi:hypothetical protein